MTILVTGGCGFIGSALCEYLVKNLRFPVVCYDKLTYAADVNRAAALASDPLYSLVQGDVCDHEHLTRTLRLFKPDAVMHLAAESHVDRSISGPQTFLQANVLGTYGVLEAIRAYLPEAPDEFKFLHVSTDEVFGDTASDSQVLFFEDSPYRPSNPYSVSKASADWLVRSWGRTFGVPWMITHGANTYGPGQLPDKLIPMAITNGITGKPITLHGSGINKRSWIHVADHVRGLLAVLESGSPGQSYCIDAKVETSNYAMVTRICRILRELGYAPTIAMVEDRPGNDLRYAMSNSKLRSLGWAPLVAMGDGLQSTIEWYISKEKQS